MVEAQYPLDPFSLSTWKDTVACIKEYRPQAVIIQWWVTFWMPSYTYIVNQLRKSGVQVIYMIHNVLPHEPRPWDALLARLALRGGTRFIVQTPLERERLLRLLPDRSVDLCPHPVYDLFSAQKYPRQEARQRLGLPEDIPVILFFGMVRAYKGLKYLLEAAAGVIATGQPVHLIIAGEFWEDIALYQSQIDALGLTSSVHLDNRYIPNEEVGLYFSAADLFTAPYTGGTQSGTIRIALSFNLPMVISRQIADEDLINNQAGIIEVIQPEDIPQFSQAISRVIHQLQNHPENGESGRSKPVRDGWQKLIDTLQASV
jgi:glycosyltransferase involved in cell wall biosynthesis